MPKDPRPYQPGDEVAIVRDAGWQPSGGKEYAKLLFAQPQFGRGMWMVQYEDGRKDTVNERRFTLEQAADEAAA